MIVLRAAIESPDGERRQLEVVAATFKQGCVELDQLRPDGWREMHIIVGPDLTCRSGCCGSSSPPGSRSGARCSRHGGATGAALEHACSRAHHGDVTQAAPEPGEDFEAWRALQEVLEERDREYWADDPLKRRRGLTGAVGAAT